MDNLKALDKEFIANTYGRFDLALVKGKGSLVYDENGKEYIDLSTGIAVNAFGIADDEWKQAVIDQLDCIQHTSNLYYSIPQVKLAKLLCERTGMKKVFFANSGAEANECAIKVARKYSSDKYGDDRNVIVTLVNSFHGRTITTLAATGQDVFHKSFGPFTGGFVYCPANDFETMKKLCEENNVCGIMMELVQGEGGVIALDKEFVKNVEALCKEKDYCMIIDEVQTGNGRSGNLYAFLEYGIKPDVVSTAKGLAGGLPMGACLIGEKCENTMGTSSHGSTFGGNPISAAAACSIISRIDDEMLAGVKKKSKLVIEKLSGLVLDDNFVPTGIAGNDDKAAFDELMKSYKPGIWPSVKPGIKCVSGMGLMLGILPDAAAKDVVIKCIENGVIPLTAHEKVRLLPALNIPDELLVKGLDILAKVCGELA
ncbi:MAG: aminotransferase class III-fold pyridoxal phosphate-dependent enzyme [Lachnospiraceae bacterium]|nr:aminotransferase class III-fold pyridoxal phosphate-dependent enzyme [Lachnospiraceae bacterium]